MTIERTRIPGLLIIDPKTSTDDRGTFSELYQARELATHWDGGFVRSAVSSNRHRGTLRGLHYQAAPYADAKMVTCIRGAVFDVVVDVRPDSATFGAWQAVELTAENRRCLFLSEGLAHGFETLEDDSSLLYHLGSYFEPAASRGIRWDDPTLAIAWPLPPAVMSPQDRAWGGLCR